MNPMTSHVAPPAGQNVFLSNTLIHKIIESTSVKLEINAKITCLCANRIKIYELPENYMQNISMSERQLACLNVTMNISKLTIQLDANMLACLLNTDKLSAGNLC